MNTLAEVVSALRSYQRIIVTGPQRTGTTIAARILACELDCCFIPEEHVGHASLEKLFELYRTQRCFVVQGPCFCPYVHLLPGAVVLMRRPLEEILRSQARIGWLEKAELDRYFATQGPIAQVKYDAWDRFQKPRLRERAFELDYHSLRGHRLWVEEDRRRSFGPRQISEASTDEAIATLERTVQLKPDDAEDHNRLGEALLARGRLAEATAHFQAAVRLKPGYAEGYYNLARALAKQRRADEAILCYRQALRLKPDCADAHKRLGDLLRRRPGTAVDEAVSSYRAAIRSRPNDAEAYNQLGCALKDMGMLDEAVIALRRACQLRPDSPQLHSSLLYGLHFHPDYDPQLLAQEHEHWNEQHARRLAPLMRPHPNDPDPNRRLRIGYVSTYFRHHPVGRFLLPLFTAHEHREFEIFSYSSTHAPDEFTLQLRSRSDRWRDVVGVTDESLAELIRQDRIDILVDLDAHMVGNRLLAFARKPAPVQATYLAYCSTTGLRVMDYRLTDPLLDPLGRAPNYAEKSVWLPETYWCYQPPGELPPVGPPPALNSNRLTFGCLNNFTKVALPTLIAWRKLLREVPRSRLLLHAKPGTHRERVLSFFAEQEVDPGRIEFVGLTLPPQYFERYQQIDIGLDPFHYAGGTTTCDALWMGAPVVSLAGSTAVGRGGVSILSNVGLADLVAQTPEEYVRLCAELAADVPRLAALRAGLRDRLLRSPLMDAARFARHVEGAFRAMWNRWCIQANIDADSPGCV